MRGPVVILGGTGYVGQAAAHAMVAAGLPVIVASRRLPPSLPAGASFVACDARDGRVLAAAIAGAETVLNAIAASPIGMVAVATALAAVVPDSVRRIVQVSSLAVFGQTRGTLSETTTPVPPAAHFYARAKYRAEQILLAASASATRTVILRPGCIFGPAAPVWSDRVGRLLLAGRLGSLGPAGAGWCGIVPVRDVAQALLHAVVAKDGIAGIHHLVPAQRVTWNEFFACYAQQLGATVAIIGRARLCIESIYALAAGPGADRITPTMLRLFRSHAVPVTTRAPLLSANTCLPLTASLSEAAAALLCRQAILSTTCPDMAMP
ncbi:MAG TPA: NAD-dependent epimerase/dehydratase family protein [Acetobacteraceae bacterium]|nr:NAD-dependent epimerase/dehydratase family protein [Acetobacteraceae bacterium]